MLVQWLGSKVHEADRLTELASIDTAARHKADYERRYGFTLCGRTVPDGAWERNTEVETCSICARKARSEKCTQTQKEQ